MKSLFVFLFVFYFSLSAIVAQNRIIFKTGNFLDCSISMINPDYLAVYTFDERQKRKSQQINYQDIVKVHGPITKSQKRIIEIRNPEIVIEESFNPLGRDLDQNSIDYLKLQVGSIEKLVPFEEIETYFIDGVLYKYYNRNGIVLTMNVSAERNYGKYFVANISIQNLTGDRFEFLPSEIKALHMIDGGSISAQVLNSEEYMKIVDRRQSWNSLLVSFGQTTSAMNAGYSTSSTNTNIQGNINQEYSGQIGSTSETYQGNTNSYVNVNVNSQTQSFDGSAQYAARQNASKNIAAYNSQQYQVRENLNAGYLKRSTIFNEQHVFGHINITFDKVNQVIIIVPINGENYCFPWTTEEEVSFN